MTALREAWSAAWTQLPPDVHAVMTKDQDGIRLPSDRAVRGFFYRAFRSELPASMRTRSKVYGENSVGPLEIDQIDQAVKGVADRLVRTARFLRTFEALATQDGLGVGDKREALLSFSFDKAGEHDDLSPEESDRLLDEFLGLPGTHRLRRLLDDDDVAAELERALAARPLPSPSPFGEDLADARGVLVSFLDDEHQRYSAAAVPDDDDVHPDTAARWAQVQASDVGRWHVFAPVVGLTSFPVPVRPAVRDPRRRAARAGEGSYVEHWLDTSLERRVWGALDIERADRVGLPDERVLLEQELDRAVAPLGLADRDSQALVALGIALVTGLDKVNPGSRASRIVGRKFEVWLQIQKDLAERASIPGLVLNLVDDPVEWYIAALWRRAHGHDVRGTVAHTPHEVMRTLIGIGSTASRRLGELSLRLSNELRRETRDIVGERVEAVVLHALSIGEDPTELHSMCWHGDPRDPADVAQWASWAAEAGQPVSLRQLVRWRERNMPL